MAEDKTGAPKETAVESSDKKGTGNPKRQIPGNLPYTTSVGVFRRALEKLIESERPTSFNRDFMNTVLDITGGASNPVIPILKKIGFIGDSGVPTELYSEFQTVSGRSDAALQGLRRGFSELFKRNQYVHKADKDKVVDINRSITGLPKDDAIIGYIYGTFEAIQKYARSASEQKEILNEFVEAETQYEPVQVGSLRENGSVIPLSLSYQINIVLPETSNVEVFNAIFKSLRESLLR